jgi:hypothetical protein
MPGRPKGSRNVPQRFRRHAHDLAKSDFPLVENGRPAAEIQAYFENIKIEATADFPEPKQNLAGDVFTSDAGQPVSCTYYSSDDPCADEKTKSVTEISGAISESVAESEWNDPFHEDWLFWKRA